MKNLFRNKRITIMGLGLHGGGVGAVKFFAQQGAKLLVTDLRKRRELKESLEKLKELNIKYVLGKHRKQDFINTDLIVKNPAVPNDSPFLKIAKMHSIPITTDVAIFFKLCKAPIIGITGTKGKSTTTSLIAHILKSRKNIILSGIPNTSVLEDLPKVKKNDIVILELSSWDLNSLKYIKKSPHISVITNIFPDHLNTYKNIKEYINDKKNIFRYQTKKDILILNSNNGFTKELKKEATSKTYFYDGTPQGAGKIIGKLYKIPDKYISKAINSFKGLKGRLELIKEIKKIKFINDTCATIPEATIYGINRISKNSLNNIILIAGGKDKKLNFKKLADTILKRIKLLILLPGDASEKIKKELNKNNYSKIKECKNMKSAVRIAYKNAEPGDFVLLSPASASFNLFKNAYERGNEFDKEVFCLANRLTPLSYQQRCGKNK